MTVRKISGVLTFILALVLVQPLDAQITPELRWNPDRPDSRAPISLTDGRTLKSGEVEFGLKYFNQKMKGLGYGSDSVPLLTVLNAYWASPSQMVTQGAELNLMIGLTDRLTLSASGNFVRKEMVQAVMDLEIQGFYWLGKTESLGPEDVKVSALLKVLDQAGFRFHLHAGVSIPVGLTDFDDFALDPEDPFGDPVEVILPYPQQLGSGTFDLLPGFTGSLQNEKATLGFQWKGTVRLGDNDRGWALGDRYVTTIWGAYKASEWASVSVGAKYMTWGDIEGFDTAFDTNTSLAYYNPAYEIGQTGRRVDIPLDFSFIVPQGPFSGYRLTVEYLMPVHQDLDYLQFRHGRTLTVGLQRALSF